MWHSSGPRNDILVDRLCDISDKQIVFDHFIIGWGNFEVAELFWLKGDNKKALEYIKACKKVSSRVKYSLESRVMFKVMYPIMKAY